VRHRSFYYSVTLALESVKVKCSVFLSGGLADFTCGGIQFYSSHI
jgi:hypothetical protein